MVPSGRNTSAHGEARRMGAAPSRRSFLKYGAMSAAGAGLALAGCGTTTQSGPAVPSSKRQSGTLTMWTWAGGGQYQSGFEAVMAAYPEEFSGAKVNVLTPVTGDYLMAEKLNLALSGHTTLPDIVQLNYTELSQFASAGVLENLDAFYPSSVENNLYSGAAAISKYGNTHHAFPHEVNGKLFYYRADMFGEAGIDAAAIQTVDDFIAAGRKFTQKFPGQYIMNLDTQPPAYLFGEMISAFSPVEFANQNGDWYITSNPAFLKTFEVLSEIKTSGIAYPVDDFTADWPEAIKNERICGFLIAAWMKNFLPQYASPTTSGKWKAVLWPTFEPALADQRYGSDAGGSVMIVLQDAPNKDLALALAQKAVLDEKGAMAFFGSNGNIPVLTSVKDEVISSFKNQHNPAGMSSTAWSQLPQNFLGADYYNREFECYDFVKIFGYDPGAIKEWGTILPQYLDQLMSGSQSPSAVLSGMQQAMESQLDNPYLSQLWQPPAVPQLRPRGIAHGHNQHRTARKPHGGRDHGQVQAPYQTTRIKTADGSRVWLHRSVPRDLCLVLGLARHILADPQLPKIRRVWKGHTGRDSQL
jgi:multiple sugar transport system substrate-binding protein